MRAFWWQGRPNFGDRLTPLLLEHYADVQVVHANPWGAEIMVVGSVLEMLPRLWRGALVGTGKAYEHTQLSVPCADIRALRGPLTAAGVRGSYVLGDAGLLAPELVGVEDSAEQHAVGLIPHYADGDLELQPEFAGAHVIRTTADPLEVIREIRRCKAIVTSSLHGVIVADAWGVPRRLESCPATRLTGLFKFRDYAGAVDVPFELGRFQSPARARIEGLQNGLRAALMSL